ncbi:MAG: alanine--tRNA ligase-related protein [Hymenobacter sp.]
MHDGRWLEIGNNVLMQYEKTAEGAFKPLARKNIDTGLGFERIVGVVQGTQSVYETDLFLPVIKKIRELAAQADERAERIVADHLKAATFMIADGVRPSNTERGYILRRLIRRAIRQAKHLKIESPFTAAIADVVAKQFNIAYPEVDREISFISSVLNEEEKKFVKSLDRGLKEFDKFYNDYQSRLTATTYPGPFVDGKVLFDLFQTYGFPVELSIEELRSRNINFHRQKILSTWNTSFKEHQATSRAGAEQKFAGGLADDSEQTVKLHTATHLLNAALRDVLGDHVKQRGSNITAERLRFDFSHPQKLAEEETNQVEALVNQWIKEDLPVTRREMPLAEAERIGAQMEFGHKYPDVVSVYFVGNPESAHSKEFCGGPHVERTGVIGEFKLGKQESVGAGVRQVKATVS